MKTISGSYFDNDFKEAEERLKGKTIDQTVKLEIHALLCLIQGYTDTISNEDMSKIILKLGELVDRIPSNN